MSDHRSLPALMLLVLPLAGCVIEKSSDAGGTDTLFAAGEVAEPRRASDSPSARVDSAGSGGEVAPTAAELAELRAALIVPVQGVPRSALTDSFREARDGTREHQAIDILAPRGTPVLSAAAGRVAKLFSSENGGRMVYAVDSSRRFILVYAHLDRYAHGLADGAPLRQGQVIGAVGSTGNADANVPHLHFGIARVTDPARWWTGTPVNPYPLLRR